MIPHTKAFKRLKEQTQSIFNFAIVACYAVPDLKRTLKQLAPGDPLPFTPDFFDSRPIPTDKVRSHASEYKEALSRQIFLSSFSYFEAYFVDLLAEIVEFHGRENLLGKGDLQKNQALSDPESTKEVRKLREYPVPRNADGYAAINAKLAKKGYRFPSSLLARYGIQKLFELVDSDYIRAANIPDLVEAVLQLPLTTAEKESFKNYKDTRNKIAHGKADSTKFYLKMAVEMNNFLRDLALKIDGHVVHHFFVIET